MSRVAIAALVTVAVAGCEKAGGDTKTIELPLPKVTVHLIDPGTEPRAPLRLGSPVGTHGRYVFTRRSEIEKPRRRRLATETYTYEVALVDVSADGVRHERERIVASSQPGFAGRTGESWRDARGTYVRPTLTTVPADVDEHKHFGQPEHMAIAPEEAVGIGARWHEDIAYGDEQASVDVELISRDGSHVRERAQYHVSGTFQGRSTIRDGTAMEEFDLDGVGGSLHATDHLTVDGRVEVNVTADVVSQP